MPAIQPAVRSLLIKNEEILYKLRISSKARYMRMQISGGGLEVIIPRGYELSDAERFISSKISWIKKHLGAIHPPIEKYLFLGSEIKIKQQFELFTKNHKVVFNDGELKIISPSGSKITVKRIYSAWLRSQAKEYIASRAYKLARENNFVVNKISIRGQKTRWGSCSSKHNLSFNFKLMQFRHDVIDYVIFHELCHIIEMNHSKAFWSLLRKFCPNYKSLKKELKNGTNI